MLTGGSGTATTLLLIETVALAVAVCPAAFLAVIVKVVVALMGVVVEPFTGTEVPLMEADVALVVCHLTSATPADWSDAWMAAVGVDGGGG
jgi:hypothetical protein